MLEKIGLPAKPSMRGGSWVVDASHCQGCSSQFTFINRKHHCRRCGGLFCNSCTQQRMVLRGQGDSAVRICDPCKKLEDAARFELRYGHRSRAGKGSSKLVPKHEDDVLNEILGTDGKQPFLSTRESQSDMVSDLQRAASSASTSIFPEESITLEKTGDIHKSISVEVHNNALNQIGSGSPEELREQAVEEKKKYRILKVEGKPEEALQAFKRGKELERQAGALELALRKNRRNASTFGSMAGTQKTDNDSEDSTGRKTYPSRKGKEEKDDLASELRELGWSDADVHDADKKPAKLSLEGELSGLLGEIPLKSIVGKGSSGIDKSQVIAHKRKALMLKREGKLADAKEELKKAKILEKQLEEQELLFEAEGSDDELSALIHNMDDDKQDDLSLDYGPDVGVSMDHLSGMADGLAFEGNFTVTDDDMNDPEIAAALRSFGWSEEDDHSPEDGLKYSPMDEEAIRNEVLSLKREAVSQKRAGNVSEAMALLKKAKLLEKDHEIAQHSSQDSESVSVQKLSTPKISGKSTISAVDARNVTEMKDPDIKLPPKSRLAIQKELLGLKKKALALKREGRVDEAEEELRKGKDLERQLQEMDDAPKPAAAKANFTRKDLEPASVHQDVPLSLGFVEEGAEAEVTEQDMHDPALLSVLKNLGWNDEDSEPISNSRKSSVQHNDQFSHESGPPVVNVKTRRSKAEVQRELLALKRKDLALRRQGKTEEAEEELIKAKSLENQIAEMEAQHLPNLMETKSDVFSSLIPEEKSKNIKPSNSSGDMDSPLMRSTVQADEDVATVVFDVDSKKGSGISLTPPTTSANSVFETSEFEASTSAMMDSSIKQRAAGQVTVSPQSDNDVNPMDFPMPVGRRISATKDVEPAPADGMVQAEITVSIRGNTVSTTKEFPTHEPNSAHPPDSLKDQMLARKKRALSLKKEGKLAEAREELRQAKLLEKSLDEDKDKQQENTISHNTSASISSHSSVAQDNRTSPPQKPMSGRNRFKLQQESLSHKRQALKLRREGRIEESEAELELAKALEAQLEEFDTNKTNNKMEIKDDAVVEDLLDPQLMSALKSIGWEEADMVKHSPEKSEPKTTISKSTDISPEKVSISSSISPEKATLEEQIKAEKLRALNLKRAGKQAEALEALRSAKRLEKRLASVAS